MNKTININLGGIFFHIDEEAYKKLRKYLDAIRHSLSDDPKGKDEILTDIESRIGEILAENVKDVRQVVNNQDIEDIIEVMGKPEEYAGDEEIFDDRSASHSSSKKRSKKLYRDMSDKFLGGVSSGLAHYFGFDVIWVRLAWILLTISGFSVILYPILWILLPQANTTSEKLEMEGEVVNILNIEKKIKEELSNASKLVQDGIEDVSNHLKDGNYQGKVRNGLSEIIDLFSRVFSSIFKVGGKFIGILLLFTGAATLIALLVGGFSLGSIEILGMGNEFAQYPPFFEGSIIPKGILTLLVFFAVGIPFILLSMLGLKIISSNVKWFNRTANLSLLGVWLLSIMGLAFSGIEYGTQDANHYTKVDKIGINTIKNDTLSIKMLAKDDFELRRYYDNKTILINDVEKFYGSNVRLDIRESDNEETYLKTYKEAFAPTKLIAKEITKNMEHGVNLTSKKLLLDAYFISEKHYKSRKRNSRQSMKMVLYIPVGQKIYLDKSTRNFLNDVDNVQDIRDKNMIKHYYEMSKDGLVCTDCKDEYQIKEKSTEKGIEKGIEKENEIKKEKPILNIKAPERKIKKG